MFIKTVAPALLLVFSAGAQAPLPELQTEPTDAGSIFQIRNTGGQPLTAFLIELVNYSGSSYSLWQDDIASEPVPPGGERRIRVANMTVGAVPDYVKLQAAIYADGTSSGIPEKVTLFIERNSHAAINQVAARALIAETVARVSAHSQDKALASLRASARTSPTQPRFVAI
jgi:hypothetical protein